MLKRKLANVVFQVLLHLDYYIFRCRLPFVCDTLNRCQDYAAGYDPNAET
jgi:hypothetical protein